MDHKAIHKLLETKRFDAETVAPLEQYVTSGAYDFEANHALLKLYQLHPSKINKTIIGKILARALGQLPACDFIQHLYLIPESIVRNSLSSLERQALAPLAQSPILNPH